MLKDIIFFPVPSLTQISFQYKFPLLLLHRRADAAPLLLVSSPLSRLGFLWDCRSPHAHRLPSIGTTAYGVDPRHVSCFLCSFLLSQPEYLRGERKTLSWSAQEPRSSCLVVSKTASLVFPSPSLADALSYQRKSAFLVL